MIALFRQLVARGYGIIEDAKRELEKIFPGIVSCADILAVAARDASTLVGGPSWTVKLGRRDSTTASHTLAETDLPGAFDPLDRLISALRTKALVQGIWLLYQEHIQLAKHNASFSVIEFIAMEQTLMLDLLALEDASVLKKIKMET
ncbi:hypothetical protein HAX54_031735 [Datura stramonium]|uniref:peroxidase n=1 Tax=Datura stramonium TaxID=4076 RepID=A0ABS8SC31_DATST|nr:hypothetical protein [Datura stramonium]